MEDSERFKECDKLPCVCAACKSETDFSGLLCDVSGASGLNCPACGAMFYGRRSVLH